MSVLMEQVLFFGGLVVCAVAYFAVKWREAGNQCPHCRKADR
jgi:hypothetical protein